MITLAMISVFSDPHPALLRESHGTVLSCTYSGNDSLIVTDISFIRSVVAMVPHHPPSWDEDRFLVVEQPGLDVMNLGGFTDCVSDIDCE